MGEEEATKTGSNGEGIPRRTKRKKTWENRKKPERWDRRGRHAKEDEKEEDMGEEEETRKMEP